MANKRSTASKSKLAIGAFVSTAFVTLFGLISTHSAYLLTQRTIRVSDPKAAKKPANEANASRKTPSVQAVPGVKRSPSTNLFPKPVSPTTTTMLQVTAQTSMPRVVTTAPHRTTTSSVIVSSGS